MPVWWSSRMTGGLVVALVSIAAVASAAEGGSDEWRLLGPDSVVDGSSGVPDLEGEIVSDPADAAPAVLGDVELPGSRVVPIDTDGDGLPDDQEAELASDPADPDTDGDGLTDGQEARLYATSVLNPDSDGDGLLDGAEINVQGTHPRSADTDGDGNSDGAEVNELLTDPRTPDAVPAG